MANTETELGRNCQRYYINHGGENMSKQELGIIKKITDLRSVWSHEAHDFSKWLAQEDNLATLSDAIGIDIVLEELESPVGGFSADLFATEEGTGRKIVIENQLEDTNHDHLGKIITYAAGKGAEVVVWIVKRARDEHRQAVEWLNSHTDSNIGFFLVEIELWQINDSPYAPKFNVVERPNDWAKSMKVVEGLSDTKKLQLDYWQSFIDYAFSNPVFAKTFSRRKPMSQHWYDLSLGHSEYHLSLTANTQKKRLGAEIYINDDKAIFEIFKSHKEEIEEEFGTHVEWREANKACRVLVLHPGDIKEDRSKWPSHFDWYIDCALKLKGISNKYIK